ncbi:hypothetical protein DFJ73DRAFT_33477 [Zopfochytrium polystomum]|nr:hypothetical protein DFJ73DRAFT_33477 [Zopfochytrium polystomum]
MASDYGIYFFMKKNDKGDPNARDLVASSAFYAAHPALRAHLLDAVPVYDLHETVQRKEPLVPDFQHVAAGGARAAPGAGPILYDPRAVAQDGPGKSGSMAVAVAMHGGGIAGMSALGYGRVGTRTRVHLSKEQKGGSDDDLVEPIAGRAAPVSAAAAAPVLVYAAPPVPKAPLEVSFWAATPSSSSAPAGSSSSSSKPSAGGPAPALRRGLYSGINGLTGSAAAQSEISGVVKVRNVSKKAFAVGSIKIELEANWYTKLTAKRYLEASGTNYIGMEPLTMKMAEFLPIEASGPITLAPNQDFFASFSFPLDGAFPPSVDLQSSLHAAPSTRVSYKLTATAFDAKADVAKNKLRDTATASYDVAVPHVSAELAATLVAGGEALTASTAVPGSATGARVVVHPAVCAPGDLVAVRVVGGEGEGYAVSAATLVEFAAHKESPSRDAATPLRMSGRACVRVGGEAAAPTGALGSMLKRAAPAPTAMAPAAEVALVVPPWTVDARQHAAGGTIDARVWVEGGCVNPEGRWMNVVVGHEVLVELVKAGGAPVQVSVPVRVAAVGLRDVEVLRAATAAAVADLPPKADAGYVKAVEAARDSVSAAAASADGSLPAYR